MICSYNPSLESQLQLGDSTGWSHVTPKLAGRSFTSVCGQVEMRLELPFSPSSYSIVVFFPVSLSSNCPSRETEETSTPNKTCWKCRDNDERSTGKNATIEWDDGEKANSNLILTEIFPSVHETWYLKVLKWKWGHHSFNKPWSSVGCNAKLLSSV